MDGILFINHHNNSRSRALGYIWDDSDVPDCEIYFLHFQSKLIYPVASPNDVQRWGNYSISENMSFIHWTNVSGEDIVFTCIGKKQV